MVTTEGTFPKVGNDPVYASELNRFASAGQFISLGSFVRAGISGTEYQEVGSVVIAAGSLSNPAQLTIDFSQAIGDTHGLSINVSGLSAFTNTTFFNGVNTTANGKTNVVAGSPFIGMVQTIYGNGATVNETTAAINNLDTAQQVIITFLVKNRADSGSMGLQTYSVQSFRGAL